MVVLCLLPRRGMVRVIRRSLVYSAADPVVLAQARATIVVPRRGAWQARYNAYGVVVDSHEVAKLRTDRTAEVSLLPGTHRVELTVNWSVADRHPSTL
ncbi:hypothetical protein C8259_34395 [Nocardia nova]|uniref:Uncharacterized protein n=1 Tax=Nocardia nova TaxID=37330 RepID=A0A2T2YPZ7_9NOCA|nr:hypothetical protein C8259_34395 [Nocardia nova]